MAKQPPKKKKTSGKQPPQKKQKFERWTMSVIKKQAKRYPKLQDLLNLFVRNQGNKKSQEKIKLKIQHLRVHIREMEQSKAELDSVDAEIAKIDAKYAEEIALQTANISQTASTPTLIPAPIASSTPALAQPSKLIATSNQATPIPQAPAPVAATTPIVAPNAVVAAGSSVAPVPVVATVPTVAPAPTTTTPVIVSPPTHLIAQPAVANANAAMFASIPPPTFATPEVQAAVTNFAATPAPSQPAQPHYFGEVILSTQITNADQVQSRRCFGITRGGRNAGQRCGNHAGLRQLYGNVARSLQMRLPFCERHLAQYGGDQMVNIYRACLTIPERAQYDASQGANGY